MSRRFPDPMPVGMAAGLAATLLIGMSFAPAVAHTQVEVLPPPSAAERSPSATDATQRERFRDVFSLSGWKAKAVERAGLWGHCMIATAPTESRAFVAARDGRSLRDSEARLRPAADRCFEQAGRFRGDDDRRLRQIAIADAWRGPADR